MSNRLAYAAGRLQILVTLCLPAGFLFLVASSSILHHSL